MITSEDALQAAAIQEAKNTYPEIRRLLWAVPNAEKRSIYEAMMKKATGMTPGVWDVHFFWNRKLYIFEFKWEGGKLTSDTKRPNGSTKYGQKEWGNLMSSHGAVGFVIMGKAADHGAGGVRTFLSIIETILATSSLKNATNHGDSNQQASGIPAR